MSVFRGKSDRRRAQAHAHQAAILFRQRIQQIEQFVFTGQAAGDRFAVGPEMGGGA